MSETEPIETSDPKESVEKWDKDLETILLLNQLSNQLRVDFILRGGMAVEAYLGGIQQREHGDIDFTAYLNDVHPDKVLASISEIVKKEITKWELYSSDYPIIEFREKSFFKKFFDKRRLEIKLQKDSDPAYETGNYLTKKLFNSKGREFEVKVMDLSELAAMKIRNIFMSVNKIGQHGRPTSETDYGDLNSLLQLSEHDKNRTIEVLSKILIKNPKYNLETVIAEAQNEYDFVINLLVTRKQL